MAPEKKIYTGKLGVEDLLIGEGTVTQMRNGVEVQRTAFNAGNLPFDNVVTLAEAITASNQALADAQAISGPLQAAAADLAIVAPILPGVASDIPLIPDWVAQAQAAETTATIKAGEANSSALTATTKAGEAVISAQQADSARISALQSAVLAQNIKDSIAVSNVPVVWYPNNNYNKGVSVLDTYDFIIYHPITDLINSTVAPHADPANWDITTISSADVNGNLISVQFRHALKSELETLNPVLKVGEIAFEYDTLNFKIGNSVDAYTALKYATDWTLLKNIPSTIAGFGITDAYTKTEVVSGAMTLTNKILNDASNFIHANAVHYKVKAVANIPKGAPVKYVGFNAGENAIEVNLANQATAVAIGIAEDNMTIGSFGTIIASGYLEGVDTSSYTEGQILYVDGTGQLTATEPTTGWMQPIAFVLRSHASQGAIQVNADYPKQDAGDIRFDKTTTTLASTKVQGAIKELDDKTVNLSLDVAARLLISTYNTDMTNLGNTLATKQNISPNYTGVQVTLPSATTLNIGAAQGDYILVTGTTSITAFDTVSAGVERTLLFDGSLTIVHGANIVTPDGTDISASAGKTAVFRSEGGGIWRLVGGTLYGGATTGTTGLSAIAAYHLLSGELYLSSTDIRAGFATTLYTGNGSTQSITTGVDMATQWGNDVSETFGGLVWVKSRSSATNHYFTDTVRGATNNIFSDSTAAQATNATGLTAFSATGFSLGALAGMNTNLATYASWNFQTTHRVTGTTNHGKAYECHFNPYTGFTIVKYEGSGLAGHEIPHFLGRKLAFYNIKNLSVLGDWISGYRENYCAFMNLTNAEASNGNVTGLNDSSVVLGGSSMLANQSGNTIILYGWANSYFDESNTLIGNYEIGVYQGTGAAGLKVTTRGKPAWLLVKRLDSANDWEMWDNKRGNTSILSPNASASEASPYQIDFNADGFTITTTNAIANASGGQYLYMVVYDNDSGSGKSKYTKPLDNPSVQINAKIPFANGINSPTILDRTEILSSITLTEGKNYVYADKTGAYGVNKFAPYYGVGSYDGFGDIFDNVKNSWYSSVSVFSDKMDNTSNWTADELTGGTASTISSVNGELKIANNGATYGAARTNITTVAGKRYRVRYSLKSLSAANVTVYVGSTLRGNDLYSAGAITVVGDYSFEFTAVGTTTYLMLGNTNISGAVSTWDNVSVYPIRYDGKPDMSGATVITNSRNYLDAIVYADVNGQPTYVEQLPKTIYLDEVKANKFKGKNACTAWVLMDFSTTPVTIKDSYNIKAIIRTGTGVGKGYFEKPMDNLNYGMYGICGDYTSYNELLLAGSEANTLTTFSFSDRSAGMAGINGKNIFIAFLGGKS